MSDVTIKNSKDKKVWGKFRKPSIMISMENKLNKVDFKIYTLILSNALHNIERGNTKNHFIIHSYDIKPLFDDLKTSSRISAKIRNSLNLLSSYRTYLNMLGKDKKFNSNGEMSIIENVNIKGISKKYLDIHYSLPDEIYDIVSKSKSKYLYGIIDPEIVASLKTKYSIILYELIQDYKNLKIPKMDINTLRKIFGISGKYRTLHDVIAKVVNPTINELNRNPKIDFEISYNLDMYGGMYTAISFNIRPKMNLNKRMDSILEEKIVSKKNNMTMDDLLSKVDEKYRDNDELYKVIDRAMYKYSPDYILAQIIYTNSIETTDYISNLKSSISNDYAQYNLYSGENGKKNSDIDENDLIENLSVKVSLPKKIKKKSMLSKEELRKRIEDDWLGSKIKLKNEYGTWEVVFVDEPRDDDTCHVRLKHVEEGYDGWLVIENLNKYS